MNNLTVSYTENGRTVTYSKELPDSPMVDDVVDTYLAAYDSFGFQNDLDVIIRNGFFGDTKISIDSENYISHNDYNEQDLEQYKYQSEMYYDAWSAVWDTLCENLPWDLQPMLLEGSGIENAKETIMFLIDHYNESQQDNSSYRFNQALEELLDEIEEEERHQRPDEFLMKWSKKAIKDSQEFDYSGQLSGKPSEKWYMGHKYSLQNVTRKSLPRMA